MVSLKSLAFTDRWHKAPLRCHLVQRASDTRLASHRCPSQPGAGQGQAWTWPMCRGNGEALRWAFHNHIPILHHAGNKGGSTVEVGGANQGGGRQSWAVPSAEGPRPHFGVHRHVDGSLWGGEVGVTWTLPCLLQTPISSRAGRACPFPASQVPAGVGP